MNETSTTMVQDAIGELVNAAREICVADWDDPVVAGRLVMALTSIIKALAEIEQRLLDLEVRT